MENLISLVREAMKDQPRKAQEAAIQLAQNVSIQNPDISHFSIALKTRETLVRDGKEPVRSPFMLLRDSARRHDAETQSREEEIEQAAEAHRAEGTVVGHIGPVVRVMGASIPDTAQVSVELDQAVEDAIKAHELIEPHGARVRSAFAFALRGWGKTPPEVVQAVAREVSKRAQDGTYNPYQAVYQAFRTAGIKP